MSKNFMKKTLAGIFAVVIVTSSTPIAPFVPVMDSCLITASAEGNEDKYSDSGNLYETLPYSGPDFMNYNVSGEYFTINCGNALSEGFRLESTTISTSEEYKIIKRLNLTVRTDMQCDWNRVQSDHGTLEPLSGSIGHVVDINASSVTFSRTVMNLGYYATYISDVEVEYVDYENILKVIDEANAFKDTITEEACDEASLKKFKDAYATLTGIGENYSNQVYDVTQEEIDQAISAYETAKDNLEPKYHVENCDYFPFSVSNFTYGTVGNYFVEKRQRLEDILYYGDYASESDEISIFGDGEELNQGLPIGFCAIDTCPFIKSKNGKEICKVEMVVSKYAESWGDVEFVGATKREDTANDGDTVTLIADKGATEICVRQTKDVYFSDIIVYYKDSKVFSSTADCTVLNDAIKEFEALNESDYTAESWNTAKTAYEKACALCEKTLSFKQQDEVNDATLALRNAMIDLELLVVCIDQWYDGNYHKVSGDDITFLYENPVKVEINVQAYTSTSDGIHWDRVSVDGGTKVEKFDVKDRTTVTIIPDENATRISFHFDGSRGSNANYYSSPYYGAIKVYYKGTWADYSRFDAVLEKAKIYDSTLFMDYYSFTGSVTDDIKDWHDAGDKFRNALFSVEGINRQLMSTEQGTVDAAEQKLTDALDAFLAYYDADYTALEEAIASVPGNSAIYTEDSWAAVQVALEDANAVETGLKADKQNVIDAATEALSEAVDALAFKNANYTFVDKYLAQAADLDRSLYTDASLADLDAALANVTTGLKANEQAAVDAMATAIEDAIAALEEKPKYDTLYEEYLVKAPTVTATGTYNKRAYHYENDGKVVDTEKVFAEDKEVTFNQWYLRTLIQYQTNGTEFDLRFVSMLDENLDQYQKAGFIFTINGTAVSDELSTVNANTSYIVDGSKVDISAFSQPDDYFFLQNYVFDIGEIDLDASLAVTAYVVLADGTELQGTKAVTFTLKQFEC